MGGRAGGCPVTNNPRGSATWVKVIRAIGVR